MFKKFIAYYKPHRVLFFYDMLASFFVAIIGLLYPIITNHMLKDFIPNKKIAYIWFFGSLLFLIYLLRRFLRYFVQYYGHVMGVKMQAEMRLDLFKHLQKLPYTYFDNHETGKILSRMTNDLQEVSELAHHGPENFFIAGITLIGSFIYLCFLNWKLTLIIFSVIPILVIVTAYLRKKMSKAFMETRLDIAKINASVESSISGIRVTKAFNNYEKEIEKFQISNESYVKSRSKAYKRMGQFSSQTTFITDLLNVIILVAGGVIVATTATSDAIADYTTFVISISMFISPLMQIINFTEMFENGLTGFKRFQEILSIETEDVKNGTKVLEKVNGDISFNNVSFSYNDKKEVLNSINLNVKAGEVIALVGPSGGGKTTICHLLPRFYEITSGEILIDGINIKDYTLNSLRENIGIVQQDVFLFNSSIKDNILYGSLGATDEEVVEAAKNANIHDYIMSLPNQYQTVIGERGVKLSGGQKQRLSIARVFLKNPQILILDEATSALDNTTEIMIQKALDNLCLGRTTIVVAHRLSTIKNADEIVVISGGKIIEEGTHDQLIESTGTYKNLYELQFRKKQ